MPIVEVPLLEEILFIQGQGESVGILALYFDRGARAARLFFFPAPRIFDLVVYRRLLLLLGATTFLPILSVTIRRYHDVGLSSWIFGAICLWSVAQGVWVVDEIIHRGFISLFEYFPLRWFLAVSISFLLCVFNLFVASWPGTKGPNKYGPAPEKRARK